LSNCGDVVGVIGNVDGLEMKEIFEEKLMLSLKSYKVRVVHGHG
jgi:predicted phosphodiesterase